MFNSPQFQALRREYIQGALDRAAALRVIIADLRSGRPVELQQLRQEIHKLRGSGGFYGFGELSATAATAEEMLIQVLEGTVPRDDPSLANLVENVAAAAAAGAREVGL